MKYKTFSELSREEQLDLFNHWLGGGEIEVKLGDDTWGFWGLWGSEKNPSWSDSIYYRKAVTKDSVDWSHVDKKFVAMARDADDKAFLYDIREVRPHTSDWEGAWGDIKSVEVFSSYKKGTCDWKDSLVLRPEEQE